MRLIWGWIWPKALAIGIVILLWQALVLSGWRPEYVLPSPGKVMDALITMFGTEKFWQIGRAHV